PYHRAATMVNRRQKWRAGQAVEHALAELVRRAVVDPRDRDSGIGKFATQPRVQLGWSVDAADRAADAKRRTVGLRGRMKDHRDRTAGSGGGQVVAAGNLRGAVSPEH